MAKTNQVTPVVLSIDGDVAEEKHSNRRTREEPSFDRELPVMIIASAVLAVLASYALGVI